MQLTNVRTGLSVMWGSAAQKIHDFDIKVQRWELDMAAEAAAHGETIIPFLTGSDTSTPLIGYQDPTSPTGLDRLWRAEMAKREFNDCHPPASPSRKKIPDFSTRWANVKLGFLRWKIDGMEKLSDSMFDHPDEETRNIIEKDLAALHQRDEEISRARGIPTYREQLEIDCHRRLHEEEANYGAAP